MKRGINDFLPGRGRWQPTGGLVGVVAVDDTVGKEGKVAVDGWLVAWFCWLVELLVCFFFAVAPQKNQDLFELFGMPFFCSGGKCDVFHA